MNEIKVLLVDDDRVFREGLRKLIELEDDIKVVGEAENGLEAVEKAKELSPDVVLMDIQMPKMDGLLAAYHIKEINPKIGIIILTIYDDKKYRDRFEKIAIGRYLLKGPPFFGIVDSIREVRNKI